MHPVSAVQSNSRTTLVQQPRQRRGREVGRRLVQAGRREIVTGLSDLRPGDLGFGPLYGKGARLLVDAGQLMLGEGFTVGALKIEHVFVVTKAFAEAGQNAHQIADAYEVPLDLVAPRGPYAVEAMPSGAREATINTRWNREYAYVRLPEDYPGQGQDAAALARAGFGTPYA